MLKMLLNMESRDSTPDISPLRLESVNLVEREEDDDQEEGEISNENLSEISEGELCTSENFEDGELQFFGSSAKLDGDIDLVEDAGSKETQTSLDLDSPASPELLCSVNEEPPKIIPASPMNVTDEQETDTEDDDDIDEDILYLRLIALRSMACDNSEQDDMAREMHQLLEEADEAALEDLSGGQETGASEKDGADVDEDAIKNNSLVEERESRSMECTTEPKASHKSNDPDNGCSDIHIIDLVSPAPSPDQIPLPSLPPLPPPPRLPSPENIPEPPSEPSPCEEKSNKESGINVQSGLPIKNPVNVFSQPPPPPPPPLSIPLARSENIPSMFLRNSTNLVDCTRSAFEPLPPGEDFSLSCFNYGQDACGFSRERPYTSDHEAENRFFLSQGTLTSNLGYNASEWNSKNSELETPNYFQTSYDYAPTLHVSNADKNENSSVDKRVSYKRKRQNSRKSPLDEKRRKSSGGMDEEEEASLRALLLAQVFKKKENSVDSPAETVSKEQRSLRIEKKDCNKQEPAGEKHGNRTGKNNLKLNSKTKSRKSMKKQEKSDVRLKNPNHAALKYSANVKVDDSRTINRIGTVNIHPKVSAKHSKNKVAKKSLGLSAEEQKKYFPNLTKKVIIPLNDDSGTDDERNDEKLAERKIVSFDPSERKESFQFDLENFLKEVRNTSKNQYNLSKKTRKQVSSHLKAKAQSLTPAYKKKLVSSKISNLPLAKQREYQKLKELIAKKEKAKNDRLMIRTYNQTSKVMTPKESIDIEDENMLRQNLLKDLQSKVTNKDKKGETNSRSLLKEKFQVKRTDKGNLTVEIFGNKRNVIVPQNETETTQDLESSSNVTKVQTSRNTDGIQDQLKNDDVVPKELSISENSSKVQVLLKESELSLIEGRKNLSGVLYKLSAQMSQLQRQSIEYDKAVSFSRELTRQLKETENLVKAREKKVENLKNVIRNSHEEVTLYKSRMLNAEEQCKKLGCKVFGSDYEVPPEGSQNIRKKLEQIKTTAQKVKTTNNVAVGQTKDTQMESGSQTLKTLETDCDLLLSSEYVSPLEHMRSESDKSKVFDPDTLLCRFELTGKCMDSSCLFQHCRSSK